MVVKFLAASEERVHRMRNVFAGIVLAAVLLALPQAAAMAQSGGKKVPGYRDFVLDARPDGFVHAYEKGTLSRFIIEYIPAGESLERWTRMLSIIAAGPVATLPDSDAYAARLFQAMRGSCAELNATKLSAAGGDIRFRVACDPVAAGKSIPGGEGLRWELGVYRFVRTEEALYQIHYVEHGTEPPTRERREQIYVEAAAAVDQVLVCRLDAADPCPPLDVYLLGGKQPPVVGTPPCRDDPGESCSPGAIFSVPAAARLPTDPSKKKALLYVNFAEEDLSSVATMSRYANTIISNLNQGTPEVVLVIRGPSPDYVVTAADRVRVGTFLTVLRSVMVSQNVVDATAMRFSFLNFR